jgi:hypothetical protein
VAAHLSTRKRETTALVAADTFGGSLVKSRAFLKSAGYMPDMLSGRVSPGPAAAQGRRRPLRVLFFMLAEVHKKRESESEGDRVFLGDSFPMPVCSRHPNRSVQALPKRGVSRLHGQQTAILLRDEDPRDGHIEW